MTGLGVARGCVARKRGQRGIRRPGDQGLAMEGLLICLRVRWKVLGG